MDAVSHELVMELIRASRIRRAAEPGVPSTLSLAAWCRRAARADVDENEYRPHLPVGPWCGGPANPAQGGGHGSW